MATPKVNLKKVSRKSGAVYQIDYRVNGKRIRQSVGRDKNAAEAVRADLERKLLFNELGLGPATKCISFSALVATFLASKKNRVRESSIRRYRSYFDRLKVFFEEFFPVCLGDVRLVEFEYLSEFTEFALEPGISGMKTWTRETTNDSIRAIKSLMKFAVDHRYLESNPAEKLTELRAKSIGKPDFFSGDELEKIWTAVDPHWVAPLQFMSLTGLRKGELINLKWAQVDLNSGTEAITIESTDEFETKSGNSRIIPLSPNAADIVRRQKGRHADLVFTSKEGGKIHPDKIYHAMKVALKKLGLEGDIHKLRHTFASRLTMKGVDLTATKELLGHTDIKTTQIYAHVDSEHLRSAVLKLDEK